MKTIKNSFNFFDLIFKSSDPKKYKDSLTAFSRIFSVAAIVFAATILFKAFNISDAKHFQLPILKVDILPLYGDKFIHFVVLVGYELIKFFVLTFLFWFFAKFLKSIDMTSPFKNEKSVPLINMVANLSLIFFAVDALSCIHIYYVAGEMLKLGSFRLFNFEYLFIAYFVNVFAMIYKNGIELKQDNDLVV
ncbi:MAG: DUF2975 domain-containing protein [Bacteroidetes bacterium]|nr:DUF2975 domain-containing protein [Bacteroidota bacterium]